MMGGGLNLSSQGTHNDALTLHSDLKAGYFFFQNFCAGLEADIEGIFYSNFSDVNFNIGPFARYYFGQGSVKLFGEGSVGLVNDIGFERYDIVLGPGISFFINENIAIEGQFNYRLEKTINRGSDHFIFITFGFQVFLNSGSQED